LLNVLASIIPLKCEGVIIALAPLTFRLAVPDSWMIVLVNVEK